MGTVDDIFRRLDGSQSALWGLIKPDKDDPSSLLFAAHERGSAWIAIPASSIEGCWPSGIHVLGESGDCRSVVLVLKSTAARTVDAMKHLQEIEFQTLNAPGLGWCYDQDKGEIVRCSK